MFFFRSGWATKWLEGLFWEESKTWIFPITTWQEFQKLFCIYVFSINIKAKIVNKLQEITYYQGSCEVKDYLNEF